MVKRFYVYVIFDAGGIPRYVGKGTGYRMHDTDRAHNPRLQRLLRFGRTPVVKVRESLSEDEALEMEAALIRALGTLADDGPLFNGPGGKVSGGFRGMRAPGTKTSSRSRDLWDKARRIAAGRKIGVGEERLAEQLAKIPERQRESFVVKLIEIADRRDGRFGDKGLDLRVFALRLGMDPWRPVGLAA
ncbi:MAG TPA: hypothetical protein VEF90_17635 [Xanthobacteraceae bacterium]|nr:hypothetical protein [Xanthobacteraceae bacterium]